MNIRFVFRGRGGERSGQKGRPSLPKALQYLPFPLTSAVTAYALSQYLSHLSSPTYMDMVGLAVGASVGTILLSAANEAFPYAFPSTRKSLKALRDVFFSLEDDREEKALSLLTGSVYPLVSLVEEIKKVKKELGSQHMVPLWKEMGLSLRDVPLGGGLLSLPYLLAIPLVPLKELLLRVGVGVFIDPKHFLPYNITQSLISTGMGKWGEYTKDSRTVAWLKERLRARQKGGEGEKAEKGQMF